MGDEKSIYLGLVLLGISTIALLLMFYHYWIKSLKNKTLLIKREKTIESQLQTITIYRDSFVKGLELYRRMVALSLAPSVQKHLRLLENYNQVIHDSHKKFRFKWSVFEVLLNLAYPKFKQSLIEEYPELRTREIQIVLLHKGGFSLQQISDILGLSMHTVYRRNSEIRKKLNIRDRQSLIAFISEKTYF